MNDFFSNLVGRHLGTSDIIKPRTPGRFEVVHGGEGLESADGDIKQLVSTIEKRTGMFQESDLSRPGRADLSSSPPGQAAQQKVMSDRHVLPGSPDATHQPGGLALDAHPSNSGAGEHKLDSALNLRINAVLQRLGGDAEPPATRFTADEQSQLQHESRISNPFAEKNALLNADELPLDSHNASKRQSSVSASDGAKSTARHAPLTPPSGLPEIESRFNTRIKDVEGQAEPVINVTIGRVEIRAAQTSLSKKPKRVKKPTGVMPLEEYQKTRQGRGAK